ncbi:Ig-like domain containing protein [Candidatus Methanophagaceae archaeon]|nr:Ig-like domain containing protein [Methanophagales archaeon]
MKLNRNKMAMLMIAIMVTSVVITMASANVTIFDAPPQQPVQVKGDVTYPDGSRVPDGWLVTLTNVTDGTELGNDTTKYGDTPSIPQYAVKVDPSLVVEGHDIKTSVSNGSWNGSVTYMVKSGDNAVGGTITMADIVVQKGGEPGNLTTIEVTPSTATVNVNATEQFNATAKDQDGNVMSDVVITWTSSNETVGTIDAGLFTADVVGTTTVTAANGTVNGTATVTVQSGVQPVLTTIDVTPSTATLTVNATEQFNATAKDQDGNVMSDVVITWTSSNETVGTIDAGLFTADVVGTTTVTAANGTVNGTANVTVKEAVPQNLTITNLEADPNTGVNTDNPTTVSATITSSAALKLVTLYAIDTQNYQSKEYALYANDILIVAGDAYSADWDATVFKVQNETTSSGTKPVFVGKTDRWDTTTYYGVLGNLTINETSVTAVALFNTGDLKLSEIVDPDTKVSYSVEPGTTTFAPFAMDATNRNSIIDPFVLLGNLEPLDAVTLTGTAPDYNISLVKTQVPNEDYVVGMAARDEAGDNDNNETTVSVSTTEDYAVSISTDDAGITVAPNVKATYTLTVQNEGTNKTDNYTLSLDSKADVAELNITNITLDAGETQNVSLTVEDARVGTYTVNVTVESQTDTNVTDMVSTLTTVETTPAPTPTPPRRRGGGGGGGGGLSDSDGDGYSDIEELIVGTDPYDACDPNPACVACIGEAIIAKVITTPESTPYDPTKGITPPTAKPIATIPPPEKEPEEPTPKPPGFEAVFAIAGLLAVAYLVQRRKK